MLNTMGDPFGGSSFSGLKVVELSSDIAGDFTGKLLAQLGCEVVKVELPEGSPVRKIGPFAVGHDDIDHSLTYWFYNADKKSVVVNYEQEAGRSTLDALVAKADVLVITMQPSELAARNIDLEVLSANHAQLIILAVTPFGLTGPWAEYHTSDLVGLAAGGMLFSSGYDDHSIPPIRPGGNQGYVVPANFALIGALLALIEREHTGRGQIVDVSMHESLAVSPELANPFWFYPKVLVQRQTCRHAQPVPTAPALFQTADGRYLYFALVLADTKPWNSLVEWLDSKGLAADLTEPEYQQLAHRQEQFHHIQGIIEVFFMLNDMETLYREGQARGLPVGPINMVEDLFDDEHLVARRYFQQLEHEDAPAGQYPTFPIRFSNIETPAERPAPNLGANTDAVIGEWLA